MAESKRSESTHIYLLSFILPMVVLTTMFVGDWATSLGIIIPLTLYPLLDVFFSIRENPLPSRQHPAYLEWIPALHVIFQLVILATLFKLANTDGSVWTTWAAAISCGFCAGISGIVPAHELGHYVRGPRRWLATPAKNRST